MPDKIFISEDKPVYMKIMKMLKTAGFLLFMAITSTSCELFWFHNEPVGHDYKLLLSFQDASGNDLVSGIEFDFFNEATSYGEITNKNIILLRNNLQDGINHGIPEYKVPIYKYDYYYIALNVGLHKSNPNQITFWEFSPHIFGDNGTHKIVTYWNPGRKERKYLQSHECYRIEYEGREITEIVEGKATIILDR